MTIPAEPPPIEGVEHRYVDARGLRVHLAQAGEGDPVLLLHGWPQHHYMWHRVIERLAPRFRLLAPDLRGFGWTEAPGHGYDAETFARDQVALLDALGIDRVKLVGHDWGGWTGFLLGLSHPDRVERMVVCNAPHPWPRLTPGLALQAWRTLYAPINAMPGLGPFLHARAGFVERVLRFASPGHRFTDEELASYAQQFRDPARARAASKLYRYYLRAFASALRGAWRWQRLDVPTVLLFGKQDGGIPHRLVEGGVGPHHAGELRVELIPDAGHFIVDEQPELISERALKFFAA
jgi:pimeloyl-ACP methyl ester carboxylesterase